jgi:hypothetical protein
MRRLWQIIKVVRGLWKYPETVMTWTEDDRENLARFLGSPSGRKLQNGVATYVLNQAQQVVGEGGKPFECGVVTGMKALWVFIEHLKSAGVAPEADQL